VHLRATLGSTDRPISFEGYLAARGVPTGVQSGHRDDEETGPALDADSIRSVGRERRHAAMKTSLPLVLVLGLVVVLMVRKGDLKVGHALAVILFGFLLASTTVGAQINQLSTMIAGMVGVDLHR
jgi:hypothetical protein